MRHVSQVLLLASLALSFSCSSRMTVFDGGPGTDMGGADSAATSCTMDSQCGDRIACTVDHCTAGVCSHVPCPDCCPGALTCQVGLGCRTAPTPCTVDSECNDSIRCTLDSCRDATECVHAPQPSLCATGEICLPAVGCIPEPPTTCTTAADCDRGAFCVGAWSCEPEFGCQFVSLRDCDDADACTTDACDNTAGACTHLPRDADHDLHADLACGGDDCNDTVASVHPGATETCNMVDDNCNGVVDEGCCTSGSCTTSCGSTGTTTCTSSGMPGPCVPPAETCNGMDDDCDGTVDNGFACRVGTTTPCTTTCGSTGTRACLPGCTLDTCTPPAEVCNGVDDNCNGAADEGFGCVAGAVAPCMTSCGSMGTMTCSASCTAGTCTPPVETCNGVDDNCNGVVDEGFACVSGTSTPCTTGCGSTGARACLPGCTVDSVCTPPAEVCNGRDDNCNATCDEGFTCCAGTTTACTSLGFVSGSAACHADCSGYDTSTCTNCGNSVRNAGEACDGPDLGGQTCASIGMGFGSGTLSCAPGCVLNTAACSRCGNGTREPALGEQCDGADLGGQTCMGIASRFVGGTLGCGATCLYSTALCFDPSGSYVVSPGASLYCAFGAVSFSFGTAMLTVAGTSATFGGGAPPLNCSPTGTFNAATRHFDLSCTLLGGCNETYHVVGTFSDNDHWSGTLTATYTGGGCFDCTTRSFTISGSR